MKWNFVYKNLYYYLDIYKILSWNHFFKKSKYILNLFYFGFFFSFFFEHLFEINLNIQEFLLWDRFCSQPSLCSECTNIFLNMSQIDLVFELL